MKVKPSIFSFIKFQPKDFKGRFSQTLNGPQKPKGIQD